VLDHALRQFVDVHDSTDSPPTVSLCTIPDPDPRGGGGVMKHPQVIFAHAAMDPRTLRLNPQPPELVQVRTLEKFRTFRKPR
jgi:dipeptidyl-peptidase-4